MMFVEVTSDGNAIFPFIFPLGRVGFEGFWKPGAKVKAVLP